MKKCPFCNSSNITISYDYGDYAICLVCGASGPHKDRATRANAIRSWNKRKEETMCVPDLLDACRAIASLADGQGQRNMMEVAGMARIAIAKAMGRD